MQKNNFYRFPAMVLAATLLVSCRPSDEQCARVLVDSAQQMVDAGRWQQARVFIDSVHNTYPQQVEQRRAAKVLADTITYLEAKRTLAYSDSLLNTLLPQADELMRLFRYEKNADYEDHGRYVHRLLATGSNTSRNFLQAYVCDDKETIVKSYYYGAQRANQRAVTLSSEGVESRFEGTNHAFQAEGWHEIMTLENDKALELLNFVSSHTSARIRVKGEGEKSGQSWVYYLSDKEKTALSQTYQLGFLMKDINQLERNIRIANAQIERKERTTSK